MTIRFRVRAAVATASLVAPLVGAALVASPAQAANDPKPSSEAASWMKGQLKNGLIQSFGYDDVGLSIDTWYLMQSAGDTAGMQTVANAVTANASDYTVFGANAAAKTLAFARSIGADPTSYDGENVVTTVEGSVQPSGRIKDSSATDYASTIGQAFAARGLQGVPSQTKAAQVLAFLLTQQCTAGYFSNGFANSDASCNAKSGAADTDATALAVLQLAQMSQTGDVPAALAKAKTWLASQQKSDGSFGGGPSTSAPNSNSTGLAGAALAVLGDNTAAQKAAVWVRSIESEQAGLCADGLTGNRGVIAYDAPSYADAAAKGLPANDTIVDKFHRATAQAGLVLKYAPAGTGLTTTREFSRPTKPHTIRASGAAPGSTLCVSGSGTSTILKAGADGTASTTVKAPKAGTGTFVFTDPSGRSVATPIKTLNARKLKVYVATKRIHRKGTERIVVGRLAPYEPARIKLYGSVRTATANSKGKAYFTLKAGQRVRTVKVKAFGAFGGVRKGSSSFKVVR